MKKVIVFVMMMVIMTGMMITGAYCESEEKYYYENETWIESAKNRMELAVFNGERLEGRNAYLYEGILYYTDGCGLNLNSLNYDGEKNESRSRHS